jgi:hypothetical protein
MKVAIAKEHRDFFQKQGVIEFQDFLSLEQVEAFNQAINQALLSKINVSPEKWRHLSSEQVFINGRDLWRSNEELRKLISQPRLAAIASELIQKKPLRLGYDQLFPARHPTSITNATSVYGKFIHQTVTLEEISCLTGVLCGLMICLSAPDSEKADNEFKPTIFPRQPGYVTFFQPTCSFNLEDLYQYPNQRFYLIVYTQAITHYQLQAKDPHTHALKSLGYVFNDKLSDKLNPIVYR